MPNNWPKTIKQAQSWLTSHWSLGQQQPILILELLSFLIQQPHHYLIANPDYQLTNQQQQLLLTAYNKLMDGYPLAYLTSQQDFYGYAFTVSPFVLIPRPESECLIDQALKLHEQFNQPSVWLDIGTGSGCLIITLAKQLGHQNNNQNWFAGSDLSSEALKIAKKNAQDHQANIHWQLGSLLEPWLNNNFNNYQQIFIITNPPYLKSEDYQANIDQLKHEPQLALKGGDDGLTTFKQLANQLSTFLNNYSNKTIHLLTESSLEQVNELPKLLSVGSLIWQKSWPDLTGRLRFNWWHN